MASSEEVGQKPAGGGGKPGASLAIQPHQDDPEVRRRYRPFLLNDDSPRNDWVAELELSKAMELVVGGERPRILVLYGSVRRRYVPRGPPLYTSFDSRHPVCLVHRSLTLLTHVAGRSYSRLLAYEASRILFRLGCDVRIYDPAGLPQKDELNQSHAKVQELRGLSKWSDGHVWISPEQHGNLVGSSRPLYSLLRWGNTTRSFLRRLGDRPRLTNHCRLQYSSSKSTGFRSLVV